MIRDPRRWHKLRVISLASLASLLLVSVALFLFGVRQLVHLGRPATYRLNLVVRSELYEAAARSLAALRGKRVNCGSPDSVMRVVAHDVLRFAGLRPPTASDPGDYRDEAVVPQDLLARLDGVAALPPAAL